MLSATVSCQESDNLARCGARIPYMLTTGAQCLREAHIGTVSGPGEWCVQHLENPLFIEDRIPQLDAVRLAPSELGASGIDAPSADAPGIPWRRLSKPWASVPSVSGRRIKAGCQDAERGAIAIIRIAQTTTTVASCQYVVARI